VYRYPEKQKEAQRRYYERNRALVRQRNDRKRAMLRQMVIDAKSVPCMDCGGIFPVCAMDFDHRSRPDKEALVGRLVDSLSERRLRAEMAKCDVVCSNCHRMRTFGKLPLRVQKAAVAGRVDPLQLRLLVDPASGRGDRFA
jgi:hypothetical protein